MPQELTVALVLILVVCAVIFGVWKYLQTTLRNRKNMERAVKMVPMLIHLPPSTDDIQGGGRDERDVANEEISKAQVMYGIISSTFKKGFASRLYGQRAISFEIVAHDGLINYYTIVPAVLTETLRQAITAAYPSARLEEVKDPNFFSKEGGLDAIAGGCLKLRKDKAYPIATYEDTKTDASLGLINAMSTAKKGDGMAMQIIIRPCDDQWIQNAKGRVQKIRDGKTGSVAGQIFGDIGSAIWSPGKAPEQQNKPLSNMQQEEIAKIEEKTKFPGYEVKIRLLASSSSKARSEALLGSLVPVFSQFDLQNFNGFAYDQATHQKDIVKDYIMRNFDPADHSTVLNSVELASIFHLPSQNSIPTSQVERQKTREVDGPARLMDKGIVLGANEFRGEQKIIRLGVKDRQRHTYIIGGTGMGKSVLLTNLAYQDMCNGDGFCFIDPHGDAIDKLLSKVPPERMDDVILFEPGNVDNPVGMNMFEFQTEDQKDFIVQEAINMLVSLYDPGNQGIFGARAQHMFRNAALLLMSDPNGGTFIDVPRCFIDPEFVKSKLKYVKDKTVYDYWSKEFPASQKSSDAGEVTSWFVSKWGPFLSNHMMRNILGQLKSGFNIREIMDNKKILLVNLSKGKTGELNAKLLGMIFVMKIQAAAMSRADIPEDERKDFCLYVDEFQNFATESFESILSEARKFRLNLIVVNQFMAQLTDKIREAILGNCGTIICGRIGVTDAEIMEKAFTPVFTAQDLHNQANFHAIATVMMYNMPTSPFTMRLLPAMGDENEELMRRMREYALSRYGRPRAEVEKEIDERLGANEIKKAPAPAAAPAAAPMGAAPAATPKPAPAMSKPAVSPADLLSTTPAKPAATPKKTFLDKWMERKAKAAEAKAATPANTIIDEDDGTVLEPLLKPEQKVEPAPEPSVPAPKVEPEPKAEPTPKIEPEPMIESAPKTEKKSAGKPREDLTSIKIPKSPKPKVSATPEPTPAPEPEEPKVNATSIAGGGQIVQNDDGATLRWR
jgi:hypothetical protein